MIAALHWAVKGGYTNVVSYVTIPQNEDQRLMSLSNPFLSYLISHGANPDGQDSKGVTPRDLAAEAPNSIRRELGLPDIAGSYFLSFLAFPLCATQPTPCSYD